ncbi:MAG TPA: glycogen-binding domain-containing protein [Gemmatimonadales bacterium]
MPRAWAGAAAVGAVCSLTALSTESHAQTTATLDLGISTVRYDGFLSSGAAALAPSIRWERPGASLTAQGTYLRFESGNASIQGTVTGSLFSAPTRRWRGQVLGAVGGSSYAEFASFHHSIGEVRLHRLGRRSGAWIGGSVGRAALGGAPRPVSGFTAAGWAQGAGVQLFASATRAVVGDTAFSDLEAAARAHRGALVLEGYAGARVWSRGGGQGVYGEGSATIRLRETLALVLSGGRYPTDPIRGSISGRYAAVALRLHSPAALRPPPRDLPSSAPLTASDGTSEPAARLEVLSQGDRAVRFTVRAPAAELVEMAGDFTDWLPVALVRAASSAEVWEVVVRIPSGIHRIAVRIDGGAWIVPAGSRRAEDDFGGEVGIFVVP